MNYVDPLGWIVVGFLSSLPFWVFGYLLGLKYEKQKKSSKAGRQSLQYIHTGKGRRRKPGNVRNMWRFKRR